MHYLVRKSKNLNTFEPKIQLIENILDLIFKVWAVKIEDGI